MSLTLNMRIGEDFYVGDTRVVVTSVLLFEDWYRAYLRIGKAEEIAVENSVWTRVMEGVDLRLSDRKPSYFNEVKVMIEAPDFQVLRGKLYRENRSTV